MKYIIAALLISVFVGYPLRGAVLKSTARWWGVSTRFGKNTLLIFLADLACLPLTVAVFALLIFLIHLPSDHFLGKLLPLVFSFFFLHLLMKKYYQSRFLKNLAIYLSYNAITLVVILAVLFPIFHFIAAPFRVGSGGMSPTFSPNQHLLIKKFDRHYERGDVVVFQSPEDAQWTYLARIVGLPGENLRIKAGKVFINGNPLDETSYVAPTGGGLKDVELQLGADDYFMMGDNRDHSHDSREYGPVRRELITGKFWKGY